MKFVDYTFDIEPNHIVFDPELSLAKARLRPGDLYQVCEGPQGTVVLQRMDPVVAFAQGYAPNQPLQGQS